MAGHRRVKLPGLAWLKPPFNIGQQRLQLLLGKRVGAVARVPAVKHLPRWSSAEFHARVDPARETHKRRFRRESGHARVTVPTVTAAVGASASRGSRPIWKLATADQNETCLGEEREQEAVVSSLAVGRGRDDCVELGE